MTPRFFIDRPVFAWVIALGILIAGIIALRALPIEQYPSVAPPSLTINVTYPGADASTLEQNVTAGHRAGAERHRGLPLHVVEQPVERHRVDQPDLRRRHRHRPRADGRPEPPAPGRAAPARGRPPPGHPGQRGQCRLPADRRADLARAGRCESLEIGNFANTKVVDELRRVDGRRQRPVLLAQLCDAHLARPRQARQLQPVAGRSAGRGAGTEQPDPGRAAGRPAAGRAAASSTRSSRRRAASPAPSNSAPSSCAPIPTGRRSRWAMSRASSLARRATSSRPSSTASRWPAWRSS